MFNESNNLYPRHYVNTLENINPINQNKNGFIRLNIIDQRDKTPVQNATITIYVTDGQQRDVPVLLFITTINPIRIELPMANDLGTQISGPEYNFSTYNLRVDAFGYFARNVYNIRLFPNTTTDFKIELVRVTQIEKRPIIEERINIPPHLRDVVSNKRTMI